MEKFVLICEVSRQFIRQFVASLIHPPGQLSFVISKTMGAQ